MRVGDSPGYVEAAYVLRAPIAAGNWGVVGDGILAGADRVIVRFEARLRPQGGLSGDDSHDMVLARTENTFLRNTANPFGAVPFRGQMLGVAGAATAGDLLVFRATVIGGDTGTLYILNGDGSKAGGQIPRLDLPPS